ncbi:MAG: ethanolamine ammonia-lyase reactivating factor EutA [Chitinophagaceae bacterium]|nr:ethanolamine ammonia-lyase reactivating factor EutA [Chitinophagaceae bacterium]MBK9571016.1 ethanolamine ammonia-lyase reactivating factor EutA [Chitinophagaceae bacterium]MBL0129834.1 ethanolamine ammonia-lyase reactivating factor EutA [Chitinophagaceae bacterium]MBL0273361.1 ethanolamine ammonia-lyase reactivating factor EutA [Chitinophagaceae bacterium]
MRLAAIDIGSNAARLLITDVISGPQGVPDFIKTVLVRVPLRLGFDVFDKGEISASKVEKIIKTIKSYKLLLDVYEVKHLKACATSAMRDATNAGEIIKKVKDATGIQIEVISGDQEASFIYENHIADNMTSDESYLYIDVGGGSTELTFFSDGKLVSKQSFNIGTIRILKNQVTEAAWDEMKEFISKKTKGYHHVTAIGSGGNINKIFSISKRKEGKALSLDLLRDYYKEFSNLSLAQRISLHKLREDRADVIVPALLIYINVMRWADAEEIFVPKIGLADGLIHTLYEEVKLKEIEI